MQKITPFLWFEEKAHEAAEFYVSVFGEDSKILTVSTMHNTPSGTVEIVSIELRGQQFTLISTDPFRKFNEAISFVISCESQEEVDHFWEMLSAVPEAEQCGWLKDKYGVSWQIVPTALGRLMGDSNRNRANRVQMAMLKMKKIVIAELEDAYRQEG